LRKYLIKEKLPIKNDEGGGRICRFSIILQAITIMDIIAVIVD